MCQDRIFPRKEFSKKFSELKNEIDYFISKGANRIFIYGGEPYLNKNIYRALEYLERFSISCNISTNARIFSYKAIVKNLRRFKKINVTTTLFSYKKSTHDYLTDTPNSYNQTIEGIKNLIEYKIPTIVTITLTKKNVVDLFKTAKFLINLGIKSIKISGLIDQGKMVKRHDLIPNFRSVEKEIGKLDNFLKYEDVNITFEKLPLCLAPDLKEKFKYEAQHKQTMLICPKNSGQCINCDLKFNCMCF